MAPGQPQATAPGSGWPWEPDDGLLWRRVAAYVIDFGLLMPCCCFWPSWLLLLVAYHGAMEGLTGWSIGKRLVGLRVVRWDGQPPGLRLGLTRALFRAVEANALVGFLSWVCLKHINTTAGHQRLGDRITRTFVVREGQQVLRPRPTALWSWV